MLDEQYGVPSVDQALQLLQERKNLETELRAMEHDTAPDLERLQRAFVKHARAYGEAKGIEHATWREIGVPADVLREAGITRGG